MWARVESDTVTNIYTRPKALTIGDTNYPANIFSMWTSAELEAKGIYGVVIDNTNLKSGEYYTNTDQTFAFASGTVRKPSTRTVRRMNSANTQIRIAKDRVTRIA